jgi:hypothetical protein
MNIVWPCEHERMSIDELKEYVRQRVRAEIYARVQARGLDADTLPDDLMHELEEECHAGVHDEHGLTLAIDSILAGAGLLPRPEGG